MGNPEDIIASGVHSSDDRARNRDAAAEMLVMRQSRIRDYLADTPAATTQELAAHVGASAVTVRRDLRTLEEYGIVERIHGGARLAAHRPAVEENFSSRKRRSPEAKARIGARIAELVREGDSLAMNDGTTVMQAGLAIRDAGTRCTVTTNALNVALALIDSDRMDVNVLGGLMRRSSYGTYSPIDETLSRMHFDMVVLGAESLDVADGVHLDHEFDAVIARRMMARAAQVAVVADGSKWSSHGRLRLASWDEVNLLITSSCPPGAQAQLEQRGVKVIVA